MAGNGQSYTGCHWCGRNIALPDIFRHRFFFNSGDDRYFDLPFPGRETEEGSRVTALQALMTIGLCVFGTMLTRFLPFILFPENRETPKYIRELGRVLPYAVIGLLIVYCLKDVNFLGGSHGIPELIAVVFIVIVHTWKKNVLLSIAGGTLLYMVLVQYIFIG